MVWVPQFHLVSLIHLYVEIFLTKDMQRACFGEGAQTIFWIHKLELFQSSKKPQQGPNCEIGIIKSQLIGIVCISFITMTMSYHTCQHNWQLSKPKNHFVCHL